MAASNAILGFGAVLKISDGAESPTFVKIAEVVTVTWPNITSEDVEVTHHESPDRTREYIQGLKDAGEITATINWIPMDASSDMLLGLLSSGAKRQMQVITTNGYQAQFLGYVKGFESPQDVGSQLQATVTIRVSSAPVLTDVS